ncbi:MAG: hypothetical protein GF333_03825 [Candidatus Omnitrophica bacterium]|nr:hypothetical protein [Candidatus Omnitrophota bacterium]
MTKNKRFIKYSRIVLGAAVISGASLYVLYLHDSIAWHRKSAEYLRAELDEYYNVMYDLLLEQEEFKVFSEKYASFSETFMEGNVKRTITSSFGKVIETEGHKIKYLALSAERPVKNRENATIVIYLKKNFPRKKVSMEAEIAPRLSPSLPVVLMEIPMTEFDEILENWLSQKNIDTLVMTYRKLIQESREKGKDFVNSKIPVYVEYVR